ncbi:MAG: Cell surface glycoprotein [Candidatus Methanogaster sp.]|nr:MAG: Cell surface glycoprotein [ANME-2 cluster archaeon]
MNRDTRTFHSNTLLRPTISVCILLMLIIAAAGVAAAAMPPVSYFSQCDSRGGSDKLGGDGPTICDAGCALTSAAMVMAYYGVDTDPKMLNSVIGRVGYDANYYIYWSAVRNVCHNEINQIEYSPGTVKPFDTTVLNNQLDAGHPVIVNVGGHFVVVTGRSDGTYYINDPISSAKSTLDDYPSRVGMYIYSGNPPDINKPLVGDWNGNGTDTTGIYNYTTANFSLDSGLNIGFGISGDIPITRDWNGNGYDTIGVFRPSTAQFFLDYDNDGVSDMNATFGVIGDIPIVGDWDGDSDNNIGVYRPEIGEFFMDATVPDVSSSKTIYVNDDFSDDPSGHRWDTIQEGVNDADDGDTVIVYAGEYCENVEVGKSITIEGAGAGVVTVTAAGAEDHVFEVTADYVGISGFAVTGATGSWSNAGFYLGNAEHCNIFGNNASNNNCGIYLSGSSNNTLQDNTVNSNSRSGICLSSSCTNTLTDNMVNSNNRYGIHLLYSDNNTLQDNAVNSNGYYGIYMYSSNNNVLMENTFIDGGLFVWNSYRNTVKNNIVNGKHLAYLEDISNFTIQNAGQVVLVNCTNITVESLNLSNASIGIELLETDDCNIANNIISNNRYGTISQYSNDNTLANNIVSKNEFGIYMGYSSNNTLQNNIMSGNTYNFGVFGGSLSDYTQNIDTSNTVDEKPIYYWVDQKNVQIPNDAGFVGVVDSTNITVRDVTLTNNTQGILFAYSANSRIENVTISNNWHGIFLRYSSNNTLSSNTANSNNYGIHLRYSNNNTLKNNNVSNNDYPGIYLDDSSSNALTCNTANSNDGGIYLSRSCNNTLLRNIANSNDGSGIRLISSNNTLSGNTANSNNWCGISTEDSGNNTIHHNNLINNTPYNTYDSGTNTWDSGSEGNYYSDYTGTDPDGDGIGDDPHPIPGGTSIDRFPLMQPWTVIASQKGDLNGDNQIIPADATIALAFAAGGSASCDPAMLSAADVNGDGCVTSLDALMILQAATDVIEL